ncbi:serine hydrolase [Winogradskyella sp. DF17]|uniref:Serine hydrolase n=1 Tax=Winogradskyella pelagia TaxID=2819984 RepID=A0ABS3T2P9_9FLAO|nr:serine hydrolase [Winogradskyella sp. DF17]MBO3117029.1 serine hydrolase [Winogradskyella sp. DF17]
MKQFKLILISLLIFGCNSEKKDNISEVSVKNTFNKFTNLVDAFAENTIKKGNANSFAVAIYKDGEMYQNYYGAIDKDGNNKPNDSSLYEIASITKTFTGSLVAKAVLAGKIGLEDDIRKYIEGDYSNLEFEGQSITVKHLLTHSMGLKNKLTKGFESIRNKVTTGTYDYKTDSYTIDDLLKELKTVEVDKKPGTVFAYNSLGPELLAYILEKVNKKPFKEQMNVFFRELGMNDTYLDESQKFEDRLVKGYKGDVLAPIDHDPVYGAAGGAISTLPDLATYMQYFVDNKNEPWVKEASSVLFEDPEDGEKIGYLWQDIDHAEVEGFYYSKTGTSNRIQSGILICPDSNYGIVVMVNNTSDEAMRDWELLFFRDIEPMVIKFPKLNLTSIFKSDFSTNPSKAYQNFRALKSDTTTYDFNLRELNNFGYDLLNDSQSQKAIEVFKFLTEEFPENANIYDSLGEAYFMNEDYKNALISFKKALELNPDMKTSKGYIKKIEELNLSK